MSKEQLEMAARKYCELANLDPEQMVPAPSPTCERGQTFDVFIEQKRWESIATALKQHYMANIAIDYALKYYKPPERGKPQ